MAMLLCGYMAMFTRRRLCRHLSSFRRRRRHHQAEEATRWNDSDVILLAQEKEKPNSKLPYL